MFAALGSSLTKILFSGKWEGFIEFINAYTHRAKKNQEELERVNETSLGKIYLFMHRLLMHEILL